MAASLSLIFATLSTLGIHAPSLPTKAQQAPQEENYPQNALKGIAVISDWTRLRNTPLDSVRGVLLRLELPPSSECSLEEQLAPLVKNKEINRRNLLAIKNEILKYYNKHQQHLISVEIPEQDVTSGVVTFIVSQAKLGEITYTGNRWTSTKKIEKALALSKGEALDENALLNNLSWLNQNPFHYSEVVLSPGKWKNKTDVEIVTKDRFPLRVYVGGDNTGVESTGRSRFYTGFTWGDAFFVDDLLSYQFTSNSTFDKFHSHTLNYQSFLPWQHIFLLYGAYAEIAPDVSPFHNHGKEAQASFRYKIPFKPFYTKLQHQLYFGFDYKYATSALFFVGELDAPGTFSNKRVNTTQEMIGYQLEYTPFRHQLTFRMELFASPVEWLPHQSKHDYSEFRPDAKPRYFYGTLALGDTYTFPSKESISGLLRLQGSANTLIPSEQFKLGGYNSVRGYEESVFISDNAVCANLEVRSRPLHIFKKVGDALTFLAFIDYGWGYNYHEFDGIAKTATLCGIGPGLRYTINPYFNLRVDYGFKLHHVAFDDQKLGMWHIGISASY